MPIFDNELVNNNINRGNAIPANDLSSPETNELFPDLGGYNTDEPSKSGLSLEELAEMAKLPNPTEIGRAHV